MSDRRFCPDHRSKELMLERKNWELGKEKGQRGKEALGRARKCHTWKTLRFLNSFLTHLSSQLFQLCEHRLEKAWAQNSEQLYSKFLFTILEWVLLFTELHRLYTLEKCCEGTWMFIATLFKIANKVKTTDVHQLIMNKQNVAYPYNEILFSHNKGWSSDSCYNVDESWKYYVKWRKPVRKEHILYGSIYMNYLE